MQLDGIIPQTIVDKIKTQIEKEATKPDVFKTPTPLNEPSPQYPQVSPAYQPNEEELLKMFSKQQESSSSPRYQPYISPEQRGEPGPTIYEPTSPVFSPPPPKDESEKWNILAEQAQSFQKGEQVHYRGDGIPDTLWTVDYIGDRFLKIVNPRDGNMIMVTALDIYRPGDFPYSSPYAEPITPAQVPVVPQTQSSAQSPNPVFSINFSPKIITAGSDYSNEAVGQPNSPNIVQPDNTPKQNESPPIVEPKQEGGAGILENVLDFTKGIFIKKTG